MHRSLSKISSPLFKFPLVASCLHLLILPWTLSPNPAFGQPPAPVGDELIVNEVTTGRQLNNALAVLGNGDVVVVWEGRDEDEFGIFGRRIDSSPSPVGNDFQVSVITTENQVSADIAASPDGGFVVVWENDSYNPSIEGRYYDSLGQPSPVTTIAGQQTGISVIDPQISLLDDGRFVVVWEEYDSITNSGRISASYLGATGDVQGSNFTIADGPGYVLGPHVAHRPGGFFVQWQESDGENELRAQGWGSGGAETGVFTVTEPQNQLTNYPAFSNLSDGGFIVSWGDFDSVPDLRRRRFNSLGEPSSTLDVSSSTETQRSSSLTALPGGEAAMAWYELGSNSNPDTIQAQTINAQNQTLEEWTVDSSLIAVSHPQIALDTFTGDLVVAWTRRFSLGGDQEDIILRRYGFGQIFADGFESGDTTAWSLP